MYTHFTEVIMPAIPVLMEMTAGGLKVDEEERKAWQAELREELDTLEAQWLAAHAPVSPYSYKQLNDLVYGKWKLPVQRTKADGITLDELACMNLKLIVEGIGGPKKRPWEQYPECTPETFDLLIKIRGVSKNLKTYAKINLGADSKVHPGYLPESKDAETADGKKRKGAAATGRLASRDPNIQNQPKRARRVYVPDHPNFTFIEWDYSAAELWVMAAESGDPVMLADLRSGDVHQRGADGIGCVRPTFKNVVYGTMYGAQPAKISETIFLNDGVFVPKAECARVQAGIAQRWNVMWAYRQHIETMAVTDGYVANSFGRVRYFYGGSADIPSALDYVPQSTVADILWSVLKPVNDAVKRYGGRLTTTVHDSILAQVPDEHVEAAAMDVRKIMQQTWPKVAPDFFLHVDIKTGKNWGRMSEMEEV